MDCFFFKNEYHHRRMEISRKEKIAILKSLQDPAFDVTKLPDYLKFASDPEMGKQVLSRVLDYLISLDSEISAIYKIVSDEDWEKITAEDETSLGEHFETKTKTDCLALHFKAFFDKLSLNDSTTIIKILAPIFKVRTKNIQFLVFLAARDHPKPLLGYLLSRTKESPLVFSSFLASLLVRIRIDESIKKRCFNAYFQHINKMKPSTGTSYLLLLQNLIYIHCFKEFPADQNVLSLVRTAFDLNLPAFLNKDVISKFCEIYGFKEPAYQPAKSDHFQFFPFDLPIIPKIERSIEDYYISFE